MTDNAGYVLLIGIGFVVLMLVFVRVIPLIRRGRFVVLARPKPCSMEEAQRALDRLVAAGFDGEIVEDADNAINTWANVGAAGDVKASGRYVVRVPRSQAEAAGRV